MQNLHGFKRTLASAVALTTCPLITIAAEGQDRQSEPLSQPAVQRPIGQATKELPQYISGGFNLPNGWRITPAGKSIGNIEDLVLNMVASPDGRIVIASHSGYLPHGIDVFDTETQKLTQHIELKSTWLG
jgi:hypothetical protein